MPPSNLSERLKALEISLNSHLAEAPMIRNTLTELKTDISWIKKGVTVCVSASISFLVAALLALVKFSLFR